MIWSVSKAYLLIEPFKSRHALKIITDISRFCLRSSTGFKIRSSPVLVVNSKTESKTKSYNGENYFIIIHFENKMVISVQYLYSKMVIW